MLPFLLIFPLMVGSNIVYDFGEYEFSPVQRINYVIRYGPAQKYNRSGISISDCIVNHYVIEIGIGEMLRDVEWLELQVLVHSRNYSDSATFAGFYLGGEYIGQSWLIDSRTLQFRNDHCTSITNCDSLVLRLVTQAIFGAEGEIDLSIWLLSPKPRHRIGFYHSYDPVRSLYSERKDYTVRSFIQPEFEWCYPRNCEWWRGRVRHGTIHICA